jgi:hypothetical protein
MIVAYTHMVLCSEVRKIVSFKHVDIKTDQVPCILEKLAT